MPLARLAQGTRGWDLLIAVLGKNPITGEPVHATPTTLIGGFLKLIGQEEIWENMKQPERPRTRLGLVPERDEAPARASSPRSRRCSSPPSSRSS